MEVEHTPSRRVKLLPRPRAIFLFPPWGSASSI
jgi:hypothetical protein